MPLSLEEKLSKLMTAAPSEEVSASEFVSINEVFTSKDAATVMLPKVMQGVMRTAAEPIYLGTKLMRRINKPKGTTIEFPSVGVLRAMDIAEGMPYPIQNLDVQRHRATTVIKTGKVGLIVQVTDETIQESDWDVVGMHLQEAGRAMARRKEEKIFNEFMTHGWTVFDNNARAQYPEAGTRGLGEAGLANDTMAVEDIIDMYAALALNGFTPTDVLLHTLTMPIFWRNEIIGVFGQAAFGGYGVTYNNVTYPSPALKLNPEDVQGRLPIPLNVLFTPFMPFDFNTKQFSMIMIDRNEVGVIVVNTDMAVEQWDVPERDMRAIKVMERYGVGCLHSGRAVAVAKNIAYAPTYPQPPIIRTKAVQ